MKKHLVRIALGLLVVLAFLGQAAGLYDIPLVKRLEAILYDSRLRLTMPGTGDSRIVIAKSMRLCVELPAVDDWKAGPFHVCDEVALRTFRDYGNLYARLTQRGERFGQRQFLARARPR